MGSIVFLPPCPTYHPLEYRGELLWVPLKAEAAPEKGIPCLLLQEPAAPQLLIYFHGNAEDLGQVARTLRVAKRQLGIHVLAAEYPGYGICSGTPSEESLMAAADAVLSFVDKQLKVPYSKIFIMGRSLGGSPAIHLASSCACAGLVTISTFSSIQAVVGNHAGWGGWFPNMFDNRSRIREVACKTMIVHGRNDTLLPMEHAVELSEACGADVANRTLADRAVLRLVPGAEHNDASVLELALRDFRNVFPDRQKALSLAAADKWLRVRPQKLAADVVERVPYSASWAPQMLAASSLSRVARNEAESEQEKTADGLEIVTGRAYM